MGRDVNIFYKIVHDENSTTEILCNLCQFSEFRSFFAGLIKDKFNQNEISFSYTDIYSQKNLGLYGRPDIFIETDEFILLIEVKIGNIPLSKSQPMGYLKYLKRKEVRNKIKMLLFLIPETYKYEPKLKEKINKLSDFSKENIQLGTVHWEKLYLLLKNSEISRLNLALQHFILHIKRWFGDVSFTRQEVIVMFDQNIGIAISKMRELVERVREKTKQLHGKSLQVGRTRNTFGEYAFYITSGRGYKEIVYFGIWDETWKEKGFPISIGIPYSVPYRLRQKLNKELGGNSYQDSSNGDSWIYYEVPKEYVSSKNKINRITTLLLETADSIIKT